MNLNTFLFIDGSVMFVGPTLIIIFLRQKEDSLSHHLTAKVTPITAVISFLIVVVS